MPVTGHASLKTARSLSAMGQSVARFGRFIRSTVLKCMTLRNDAGWILIIGRREAKISRRCYLTEERSTTHSSESNRSSNQKSLRRAQSGDAEFQGAATGNAGR